MEARIKNPWTQKIKTRDNFPETWIWDSYKINGSQNISELENIKELVVPDTITSWLVTGFAMSKDQGIGFSKAPLEIVSKKKFFIKLIVPYSVKV